MEEVLTLSEASQFLKVHKDTIYKMAQQGRMPAFKVGKVWRFNRNEINEWIKNGSNKLKQVEEAGRKDDKLKEVTEKREFFRLNERFPVKCSLMENPERTFRATGSNIGNGGIFIEMEKADYKLLPSIKGQKRKLKLIAELPGEANSTEFCSEIAWLSEKPLFKNIIGAGLKFVDLSSETNSRLSSFILKHSAPFNDTIEFPVHFPFRLESSIVIKRKQTEVYELLNDIEKFPQFLEDIKSIKIIQQHDDKVVSEWNA